MPTTIKTLGDYIQVKRFEKGLLQSQIAQMVGVTISTVMGWEMDAQRPTQDESTVLVKILKLEGVVWNPSVALLEFTIGT